MADAPLYISAHEVEELLEFESLFSAVEKALARFSQRDEGGVVQPVRSAVCVDQHKGLLGVMPGYSAMDNALACKLVSVYPENKTHPTHQAVILLFNPENGSLVATMDGEEITTMRTAVASAVATKHLAKPNPKVLTILGTGTQAKSHYDALTSCYTFQQVRIWGRTKSKAEKCAEGIGQGVVVCDSIEEAVKDADIVCTVTAATTPILKAEWIKPGAHINSVGACRPDLSEMYPDLVRGSTVYVDSVEAAKQESGDILLAKAEVYAEVGDIINKSKPLKNEGTTIFKSLGLAVEDVVSAKLVYDKYCAKKNIKPSL